MKLDVILVVDFGSQYNQLIARRIREMGVYSELISRNKVMEVAEIYAENLKGIIFSGGPKSVYDEDNYTIDKKVFDLGVPIFGICYGMQLMMYMLDGEVISCHKREYGAKDIEIINESLLFDDTPKVQEVFMSHGDKVNNVRSDFKVIASSNDCIYAAIENKELSLYGVQFHPEVVHTIYGNKIIENFIFKICKEP